MIISNYSISNRTTVAVLVLLISLAGAYCYMTLPRESVPDVPIPFVMVSTPYKGVSPEDIESSVTMKIERKLTGLKGVKEVKSSSMEGMSLVAVEFYPNVRIEDALQYVRDKVDQAKADLPTDIDPPIITEINIAELPIMSLSISGKLSPVILKDIGDKLQDAIEQNVPGVLKVEVVGGRQREIHIEIDQQRLAMYNLTIPEIMGLIPSENVNISAGGLETPGIKFNVRVPAEFKKAQDIQDINHIVLAVRPDPRNPLRMRTVYLGDVAEVADGYEDIKSISRLDGLNSITLQISKRVGSNILEIAAGVDKVLEEARKRVPQEARFTMTMDRSLEIKLMVADLENTIGAALVLVIGVLLFTIGLRACLVVALAVPLSMLMTFAILNLMGYTLNMIVLFALVLVVGMLVDDAIVIVENIYRFMQAGLGRFQAAKKATAEVAGPVITSTLTTCAAFFPMVFWPGIMGDFMKYLPVTVIVALLSSLFVAIVVSPVVCTLVPGRAHERYDTLPIRIYKRLLRVAVEHRVATLLLCLLTLVGVTTLYFKSRPKVEFFPMADPKHGMVNIRCPQGTNIRELDRLAKIVEERIADYHKKHGTGVEMEHLVTNVGSETESAPMFGEATGPHIGNITMVFRDYEKRITPSLTIVDGIREAVADIPGAEIKVQREREGPSQDSAVTVRIIGEDLATLEAQSARVKKMIEHVPGLVNLRSDLEAVKPELVFRVDRNKAMRSGVNTSIIGNFLRTAIFGAQVSKFRPDLGAGSTGKLNDDYWITVRLPESQRSDVEGLFNLRVPNARGQAVPLSSLGEFEYRGGLGTINHVDQKRVITVTADAQDRNEMEVLGDAMEILSPLGRNRLASSDIADWKKFTSNIANAPADKPLGRFMAMISGDKSSDFFHKENVRFRDLIRKDKELTSLEKQEVLDVINALLEKRDLFSQADLAGVSIADETLRKEFDELGHIPEKKIAKDHVLRLNRLALGALLPELPKVDKLDLPVGCEIKYAGQNKDKEEAQAFLMKAGIIAIILIVLILVAQFNTLSVPVVIMSTVVLSLIGVFWGLLACHMPFGVVMTGIGVISLAGIVVKNGIVLMDFTQQLQRRGLEVKEACVEAGAIRLRPVLLTAACTVLGLVPTALGWSFDFHTFHWVFKSEASQWWKSIAVAIIFGLTFATVLTLVVVPSLYVMLYKLASALGLGGIRKPGEEDESGEPKAAGGRREESGLVTSVNRAEP